MINCEMCGRCVYGSGADPKDASIEMNEDQYIMTVDGPICGLCIDKYVENKKRIKDMGNLGLIKQTKERFKMKNKDLIEALIEEPDDAEVNIRLDGEVVPISMIQLYGNKLVLS